MSELTHIGDDGRAQMVDVGDKATTRREATAAASVRMRPETLAKLEANDIAKGDVLGVARIAAIQAAKRCDSLIPLCHSLGLDGVDVDFEIDRDFPGIHIRCAARVTGRTGVEMEAMTGASIAALTIYDMCKAVDREMQVERLRLLSKEGGRSGSWRRPGEGEA
ncbi:MAG: cyclic pyranopterin monophosphate synthase MoaC [Halieaceae bacterium]|nr:cyclic pyranopterin monophosphate synthase MoaC [Halieaceae bacterium]